MTAFCVSAVLVHGAAGEGAGARQTPALLAVLAVSGLLVRVSAVRGSALRRGVAGATSRQLLAVSVAVVVSAATAALMLWPQL
ncbi:MAG: hypothetical protein EOO27_33085 [Comamonadaceae bacterium]|nr:MAG: hypothetical protein EOO27_33085 [Comamonadaceae bacterium]